MEHATKIVDLLKKQGLEIDDKIEKEIFAVVNEVKEKGIEEGVKIGVQDACKEFELKISSLKNRY